MFVYVYKKNVRCACVCIIFIPIGWNLCRCHWSSKVHSNSSFNLLFLQIPFEYNYINIEDFVGFLFISILKSWWKINNVFWYSNELIGKSCLNWPSVSSFQQKCQQSFCINFKIYWQLRIDKILQQKIMRIELFMFRVHLKWIVIVTMLRDWCTGIDWQCPFWTSMDIETLPMKTRLENIFLSPIHIPSSLRIAFHIDDDILVYIRMHWMYRCSRNKSNRCF